ncbi:MAG TPA: hypothetical protein VI636_14175 [Candidatus Angelobacter sp.]
MFKFRFRYLLPLLLTVLSTAISAMAQSTLCDRRPCLYTVVHPGTGCTHCGHEFSLDDRWRQYLTNPEVIGVEVTGRFTVTTTRITYLFTTASGAKLAEITQIIDNPASSRRQVLSLNEEARTAFVQHAKNKNRLIVKVETAGGKEESLRVQLVAIKHQGL